MSAPAPLLYPPPVGLAIANCWWPVKPGDELKLRPVAIVRVIRPDDPKLPLWVYCAYGTSVLKAKHQPHDFIVDSDVLAEFIPSGLNETTRFDLSLIAKLKYTSELFVVPPASQYGTTPQRGIIVASAYERFKTALRAGEETIAYRQKQEKR